MLRQVLIYQKDYIFFQRTFGRALDLLKIESLYDNIKKDTLSAYSNEFGSFDYVKFRLSYLAIKDKEIIILFVTGLMDDFFSNIRFELFALKDHLINNYDDFDDLQDTENLGKLVDEIHRKLKPKIALIGFSGVGKSTIKNLIKMDKIPLNHIPTINGDIATIKIGNLYFSLWDFAGQEQYSYLWKTFIKGSDAVLIITNSSPNNVEKSKYFLKLVKKEVPYAHVAIIGNKQDLPDALKRNEMEEMLGARVYEMIANVAKNREKMVHIIAEILDMDIETSSLLEPIQEKEILINQVASALKSKNYEKASTLYKKIAKICLEDLNEHGKGNEYLEKSLKLTNFINSLKSWN